MLVGVGNWNDGISISHGLLLCSEKLTKKHVENYLCMMPLALLGSTELYRGITTKQCSWHQ